MSQHIVISSGDINGIGPEIILKYLYERNLEEHTAIILSSPKVIDYYKRKLGIDLSYNLISGIEEATEDTVNLLTSYGVSEEDITPGKLSRKSGQYAMEAVETGVELCKNGQADALVTAPISKEAVNLAGYDIPGHTEFLAERTQTSNFMMMLVNEELRVGLNSVHIPIAAVKQTVTETSIIRRSRLMYQSLKNEIAVSEPAIAVLGLNPQAGDGGIIGKEEQEIISPAIRKLKNEGLNVTGPYPADGFFGNQSYKQYDGILAMYHDQGLIPFKTLSFGKGVNFTAGLPIVRTSPDHGTAFDIAGQGKADTGSFGRAFELAIRLSENRNQYA